MTFLLDPLAAWIVTALVAGAVLLPALHILLIRGLRAPERGVALMFVSFAVYAADCAAAGLGFYGGMRIPAADAVAAAAAVGCICLSYMEFFSTICRGFSLRLLIDLHERGPLGLEEVMTGYGDSRGMAWMLRKRLASVEKLGLLRCGDRDIELRAPWGTWTARLSAAYRGLLRMEDDA